MNYKLAFALGLIAPGTVGREPVAYLYNGVRLPDIFKVYTPELQKTHPYTHIVRGFSYFLYFSTAPFKVDSNGAVTGAQSGAVDGTKVIVYSAFSSDSEWTLSEPESEVSGGYYYPNPVWSSYEVYTIDGALFLSASAPVPVYE